MKCNILISGVGGQGTLLASRVLGNYAALNGYDCKLSEVHGMAQRGGSVVTYVKFSDKVYSPVIAEGDADILLAFEQLEALRYSHFVKKDGIMIVNTQKIMPLPVITGAAEYPQDILKSLKNGDYSLITLDAFSIAKSLLNTKTVNTVMLGVLTKCADFDYNIMIKALKLSIAEKHFDVNVKAFESGFKSI